MIEPPESLMSTTVKLEVQQTDTALLKVGTQEFEMPVVEGSESERTIDISRLRAGTGLITLDEGFVNTGSTRMRSRSLMAKRASFAIAAIRSNSLQRKAIS